MPFYYRQEITGLRKTWAATFSGRIGNSFVRAVGIPKECQLDFRRAWNTTKQSMQPLDESTFRGLCTLRYRKHPFSKGS